MEKGAKHDNDKYYELGSKKLTRKENDVELGRKYDEVIYKKPIVKEWTFELLQSRKVLFNEFICNRYDTFKFFDFSHRLDKTVLTFIPDEKIIYYDSRANKLCSITLSDLTNAKTKVSVFIVEGELGEKPEEPDPIISNLEKCNQYLFDGFVFLIILFALPMAAAAYPFHWLEEKYKLYTKTITKTIEYEKYLNYGKLSSQQPVNQQQIQLLEPDNLNLDKDELIRLQTIEYRISTNDRGIYDSISVSVSSIGLNRAPLYQALFRVMGHLSKDICDLFGYYLNISWDEGHYSCAWKNTAIRGKISIENVIENENFEVIFENMLKMVVRLSDGQRKCETRIEVDVTFGEHLLCIKKQSKLNRMLFGESKLEKMLYNMFYIVHSKFNISSRTRVTLESIVTKELSLEDLPNQLEKLLYLKVEGVISEAEYDELVAIITEQVVESAPVTLGMTVTQPAILENQGKNLIEAQPVSNNGDSATKAAGILVELIRLKASGAISESEFEASRQELLRDS